MKYIDIINSFFIDFVKYWLKSSDITINYTSLSPELMFFIKFSLAIFNISLFLLLILTIINFICNLYSSTQKILRYLNILVISFILSLLLIKFYLSLKLESICGTYLYDIKYMFFINNQQLLIFEHMLAFSSSFSDAILILSFITGLICLEILGPKNLFTSINNISIFYMFNLFVTIMVSTNNLLIMFLSFECIFLPTMYFVYKLGYSKKVDRASKLLFYWTLFGSFLVLCNIVYIYYTCNSLNYIYLMYYKFSKIETQILFIFFLIGFGIKIPLAPLHYWLLKVHVEAPTAFSIFLSGFLVKSAFYCLFMLINILNVSYLHVSLISWILYSLIIGTLGLARQVDIKKLIAWATIQEMSFMLLFLVFKQFFLTHTCILFILLHGIMSSYMFYLIDIIQRRYKNRSLQFIRGLNITLPKLTKHIWFLILLFSGFPLTAKFIIEWNLILLMVETNRVILLIVIFLVNFLGAIFFCRTLFTILYGIPEGEHEDLDFLETQKKEYSILNFLSFFIVILTILIYTF